MASNSKGTSAQRDQWFKFAFWATIIWVVGLVLVIIAGAVGYTVSKIFNPIGWILMVLAWVIILIFGIFTIIYSLTLKDNDQILGIICGALCIIFPLAGVIMAWILYYKK